MPSLLCRNIPCSGETLPAVGLGTWRTFDVAAGSSAETGLAKLLRRFLDLGGSLVDTSPMYGAAEQVLGELTTRLGERDRLFLATKVWTQGRERGIQQMQRSFDLLKASRVELMQVHNLVDVAKHLGTLRDWRQKGRIRYIGITHYHASAHAEVASVLRREPVDFLQINYSPFEPEAERELLPLASDRGVAVIANRPFGGRAPGGRSSRPLPPVAAELGASSWAQLALAWILAHPAVTCVIPATARLAHLEENLAAARLPLPDRAQRLAIGRALA